jgi:CheY-like chemotaxis protein
MVKVLLVDDDVDLIAMNKAVLEKEGFEVAVAYDGAECKAKAAAEKPDIIVLDVMMTTDTEGIQVARELRTRDETRAIPIVMLTSIQKRFPLPFQPGTAALPVQRLLDKPASPRALVETIREVLGHRS